MVIIEFYVPITAEQKRLMSFWIKLNQTLIKHAGKACHLGWRLEYQNWKKIELNCTVWETEMKQENGESVFFQIQLFCNTNIVFKQPN